MSRIISDTFTVRYHPCNCLITDMTPQKYEDLVYDCVAARYIRSNGSSPVQEVSRSAYLAYGLDHAMGFWFDLYYDDCDEPIVQSSSIMGLGRNASKRQMLHALCLLMRDTDAHFTPRQLEIVKGVGEYVDQIEYTIIDPRAVKLILMDLDPERYTMYEQAGDYENEGKFFEDTFTDMQNAIASHVTRQNMVTNMINDARQGAQD
jgi:hypothetical protein